MALREDEFTPIRNERKADSELDLTGKRRALKPMKEMHGFETIAEEKEEDISSDGGSQTRVKSLPHTPENKNIFFGKPRMYITSRVTDKKGEAPVKEDLSQNIKSLLGAKIDVPKPKSVNPKMNLAEVRRLLNAHGPVPPRTELPQREVTVNTALVGNTMSKTWREVTTTAEPSTGGWTRAPLRHASSTPIEPRVTPTKKVTESVSNYETKRSDTGLKEPNSAPRVKSETTDINRKEVTKAMNVTLANQLADLQLPPPVKLKQSAKNPMSVKDAVNVYKKLSYGSNDDIKSFVEKLSFVKDDKAEDKNLISMMNLKALENKIKDLGQTQPKEDKKKAKESRKLTKKQRRERLERLARHKVVKVPNTLEYTYSPDTGSLSYGSRSDRDQVLSKRGSKEEEKKEPWRYVGTQSVLDKGYFVYPAYPVFLGNQVKKKKKKSKGQVTKPTGEMTNENEAAAKVNLNKKSKILLRQSKSAPTGKRAVHPVQQVLSKSLAIFNTSSASNKPEVSRSAASVCNVEFYPRFSPRRRPPSSTGDAGPGGDGLLLHLHGERAINVRSPYVDKQFARVKYFRRDGSLAPLIKGAFAKASRKDPRKVSVKTVELPRELIRAQYLETFNFEDDIANISEFLSRQNEEWSEVAQDSLPPIVMYNKHEQRSSEEQCQQLVKDIERDMQQFDNLPNTEENRRMVADMFQQLEKDIEASMTPQLLPIEGY